MLIGSPEDVLQAASTADPLATWALRLGVVAIFGYAWRNERKQHSQDLVIKELELNVERTRPHKDEFEKLRVAVERVDRLVRLIAAKQGISTRDEV